MQEVWKGELETWQKRDLSGKRYVYFWVNGVYFQAKQRIHDIWMAPDSQEAEKAFDLFIETYQAKYSKAAECAVKDRYALLTFSTSRRSVGFTSAPPTPSNRPSPP